MRTKWLLIIIAVIAVLAALSTTDLGRKYGSQIAQQLQIAEWFERGESAEHQGAEGDGHSAGTEGGTTAGEAVHSGEEQVAHGKAEHGDSQETHAAEGGHHAKHKLLVTTPQINSVKITERYVCQIHSRRHIEIRALNEGYLQDVLVKEGQAVKEGDRLFTIVPVLYQARLDSDVAEAQLAQVEYDNTKRLVEQQMISDQELKLAEAKLAKAKANVARAQAELEFSRIKAPFDGIVDRLFEQKGSLLEVGDMLTTLSDNSVMWAYFNVREARYLEYQEEIQKTGNQSSLAVELELANHKVFPEKGVIGAIEADFDNETGNIAFRADIPNPNGILRHGQTGTILIQRNVENALIIPQRSTFEILAKTYVFVVDENNVVHQREIEIEYEQDDIFLISKGLAPGDRIVYEGQRDVRDGEKVEYEFEAPEAVLGKLKYHAE